MNKHIDEFLKYDPLAEAERCTGKSYKNDNDTSMLGMLMALSHNQKKRELLSEGDDTHFGTSLSDYIRIIENFGFEKVLEEQFQGKDYIDTLYIYWLDGILLKFDTYWGGKSINSGDFYYNYIGKDEDASLRHISTGRLIESKHHDGTYVLVGSHDCREAIIHKIKSMKSEGKFLTNWIKSPHVRLLNYSDWKNLEYPHDEANRIHNERVSRLPKFVQDAIKGEAD